MSKLLDRWQDKYNEPIFRDGTLSQCDWDEATPKILFLLKECYRSSEWFAIDGPIDIRGGKNKQFFPNIARWKYLVKNFYLKKSLPNFPEFENIPEIEYGDGRLKDIAYVNVKKTLGTSSSNNSEIQRFALKDKDLLVEQIDQLNPDIVFCCSTFWSYHPIYDGNNTITEVSDRVFKHEDRLIINYYHPGHTRYKGGQKGLYDTLKSILSNCAT